MSVRKRGMRVKSSQTDDGPKDRNNWPRNWRCWLKTTAGIIFLFLLVQFLTGLLLTFFYVPSTDHAHTTVAYIEKVLPAGSWIRALHHHASQWLPVFLLLHLAQLFWREAYRTRPVQWLVTVLVLVLVMVAAATGYSLPWDARAFFSTRVAEGIVAGLPLAGASARLWLLGGNEISTLTLSRFFALHVFVTPLLIGIVMALRWRQLRQSQEASNSVSAGPFSLMTAQLFRNSIVAGLAFLALALFAKKFPAPLGPPAATVTTNYLPRPGAQFIWLYELLKHVPGGLGSLVGLVLPGVAFLLLALLPWLNIGAVTRFMKHPQRNLGGAVLVLLLVVVTSMTIVSYEGDRRDPRTREQLLRQRREESEFRIEPFKPSRLPGTGEQAREAAAALAPGESGPPPAFTKFCAQCHGEKGEGARQGPLRFPPLQGVAAKPKRTVDDIVALLNDPTAYGLEPPMRSFAGKLTEEEKRQIAEWVVTLK